MNDPNICTTKELARIFGVSQSTILYWVRFGFPKSNKNEYNFIRCLNWVYKERETWVTKKVQVLIGKKFYQIEVYRGNELRHDKNGKLKTHPSALKYLQRKIQPILSKLSEN